MISIFNFRHTNNNIYNKKNARYSLISPSRRLSYPRGIICLAIFGFLNCKFINFIHYSLKGLVVGAASHYRGKEYKA